MCFPKDFLQNSNPKVLNQKALLAKLVWEPLQTSFLSETYSAYFYIKVFKTYSKEPVFYLAFPETWPSIHVHTC